jgi:hypothetical protein
MQALTEASSAAVVYECKESKTRRRVACSTALSIDYEHNIKNYSTMTI